MSGKSVIGFVVHTRKGIRGQIANRVIGWAPSRNPLAGHPDTCPLTVAVNYCVIATVPLLISNDGCSGSMDNGECIRLPTRVTGGTGWSSISVGRQQSTSSAVTPANTLQYLRLILPSSNYHREVAVYHDNTFGSAVFDCDPNCGHSSLGLLCWYTASVCTVLVT